jgi:hypothetical protein
MKAIRVVTEESRTRFKNALRRYITGAIVSCVLGCVVGIAVSVLWVPHRLKPLQRYYFASYVKSACLSYVPIFKPKYTLLKATLTDPRTKKELTLSLNDDFLKPVLDEDGNQTFDNQDRPMFTTKLHTKQFFWSEENVRSDLAYAWFKSKIFEGQTLNGVCRIGWFWVLLVSFLGAMVYPAIDVVGHRDYLKIIDEVHALKHLSALPLAITEGRKHGLKLVIGTQNKSQIEEYYGHEAKTMLASFSTKIILRCNEPECARWLSDLIGEDETERVRMSATASVQRHGRDSINYNNVTEHRSVVSKEEIMSLPNLHGYWKHGNLIVPFRIEPLELEDVARNFIQRKTPPKVSRVADQPRIARPHENGRETPEIATATVEEIDISF